MWKISFVFVVQRRSCLRIGKKKLSTLTSFIHIKRVSLLAREKEKERERKRPQSRTRAMMSAMSTTTTITTARTSRFMSGKSSSSLKKMTIQTTSTRHDFDASQKRFSFPPPATNKTRRDRGQSLVVSANLFSRFTRVVSSYANALITAAEDPEKILDQTVNEMNSDLIKMRQATAQVMASQKQLENKYNAAQKTADDWYKRAQLAIEKGDDDLAREALTRRKSYQENADGMKENLLLQKEAVEKLVANTRVLETKMAEAKAKKDTLKARAASAKTNKAVADMVQGVSTSSALSAFERMEEKVLAAEAEAEAVGVLTASDALEEQFKMLESGSVEDELAAMKGLKSGSGGGSLPEGRPVSDAIESELEALRKKSQE
jgi:phage shock protein A